MISVIIVNWNGKSYLEVCLKSLFNQSLSKDEYEVILVDNGSEDDSIDFVKKNFPLVRIVKLDKNVGFAKGSNIGVEAGIGELIAFLNNDTEVDKNWLYELKKSTEEHPEIGFFASKILLFDKRNIIDSAGDFFSIKGYGYKRGHSQIDVGQYNKEEIVFGVCACACMFRKNIFKKLGGFDEDFFAYGEDVDLNWRCHLAGYKCLYVPTAITYHKLAGTSGIFSDTHIYYTQRNQEFVLIKNASLKYHVIHIFANIYSLFKHLFKGRIKPFLKAKFDALRYFPQMLKKRKKLFFEKEDELKDLLEKFKQKSYPVSFINDKKKEECKEIFISNTVKLCDEFIEKSKIGNVSDLITLGKGFWWTEDRKYFNLFLKEFSRFTEDFNLESKNLLHLIYSYYFFKDSHIPEEIKKKFLKILINYTKKQYEKDDKIEYLINQATLFLISVCFPFIPLENPIDDGYTFINELVKRIDSEGMVNKADTIFNIYFLEIFTIVYSLMKLNNKKVDEETLNKVKSTFEFVLNLSRPNGKYEDGVSKILSLDGNSEMDVDYILLLKFIVEDEMYNIYESKCFESVKHDSCGYSKNKIYIMKNSSSFLFTDVLTYSIFAKGKDLITKKNDRVLEIDDSLMVYDKNFKTNLWIVGVEYDFLDVSYELTPSVIHKRQIYFNKKENYWIIRDRLEGKEEHLVKIKFFVNDSLKISNINTHINKLTIRDYINKFIHVNKLAGSFLKLSAEEELGVSLGSESVLLPLNNPNLIKVVGDGFVEYKTHLLLPNEITFLIF
ncbi:MAG: glycosyltransferase family 2 protein [Candidatus Firestonebacteria bacterium]